MKKKQAKAARKPSDRNAKAASARKSPSSGKSASGKSASSAKSASAAGRPAKTGKAPVKASARKAASGAAAKGSGKASKPGAGKAKSPRPAAPKAPSKSEASSRKQGRTQAGPKARSRAGGEAQAGKRPAPSRPEPDLRSNLPSGSAPAFADGPEPEAPSRDERAGLDKVMASLTQIFGGRDFMSDEELDALLDDKMASGEIPPSAALDPLDEAQSLIYEAWNTEGPRKAMLARRALELSEDCADAYLILAQEEGKGREAALDLYRRAYEAGRRALDPALFVRAAGNFWGIMETRPYMRARLALAECLWDLARKDEALDHLRELMRLNPSDNQGVRYILLQCLLESGADEELGDLLARYGRDASAAIAYTRALWQFRREGRGKTAEAALAEALQANPHVPAYLLKRKSLPARAPLAAGMGSPEEAEAYAAGSLEVWHQTLGALDWLASRA